MECGEREERVQMGCCLVVPKSQNKSVQDKARFQNETVMSVLSAMGVPRVRDRLCMHCCRIAELRPSKSVQE